MRWPQWYPTRADIVGILFALVVDPAIDVCYLPTQYLNGQSFS